MSKIRQLRKLLNVLILPAVIGGGLALLGGALSGRARKKAAEAEREYAGKLQRKTWRREDSAVRRHVRDLKAAGLNPVLAAGGGAQTTQPMAGMEAAEAAGEEEIAIGRGVSEQLTNQQFASTALDTLMKQEHLKQERLRTGAMQHGIGRGPEGMTDWQWNEVMSYSFGDLDAQAKVLDNILRRQNISIQQVQKHYQQMLKDYQYEGLNAMQMEIISKYHLLSQIMTEDQLKQMDLTFFKKSHLPPVVFGATAGAAHKAIGIIPGLQ